MWSVKMAIRGYGVVWEICKVSVGGSLKEQQYSKRHCKMTWKLLVRDMCEDDSMVTVPCLLCLCKGKTEGSKSALSLSLSLSHTSHALPPLVSKTNPVARAERTDR